jgi:hypothetical protein
MRRCSGGYTFIEVIIAGVILSILGLILADLFGKIGRQFLTADLKLRGQTEVGRGLEILGVDLFNMNQIDLAVPDQLLFRLDSRFLPGYRPTDLSTRNIPKSDDPDDDDDKWALPASALDFTHGSDLDDDDDDGDGMLDVQCRVRREGTDLVREYNFNEVGWTRRAVVAKRVTRFQLSYWGSKTYEPGATLDLGDNGMPDGGFPDNGENDGRISAREIDWVLSAQGGVGDRSGALDTPAERFRIAVVNVLIAVDANGDGREDFVLDNDVVPPLLPLKVRRTGL